MTRSWRDRLRRALASTGELEADGELVEAALHGTAPVADCRSREQCTLSGVLRSVRYAPRDAAPELAAELYDGSGSVELVWLGRREIAGIEPGRRLLVSGRVSESEHRLVMYNPAYTLLAPMVAS